MYVHNDVLDASHAEFAETTRISVCSAQPANFAGIAAVLLAEVAVTPGLGNGDFTVANGDVSGRKVTVAAQPNMPVTASGTGTHAVYDDGSRLLRATDLSAPIPLTDGGTVSLAQHDVELRAPVAE